MLPERAILMLLMFATVASRLRQRRVVGCVKADGNLNAFVGSTDFAIGCDFLGLLAGNATAAGKL